MRIINDILDYSKAAAEKLTLESIPFSIHQIVDEVLQLFRETARRKRVTIKTNIASGLARCLYESLYKYLFLKDFHSSL